MSVATSPATSAVTVATPSSSATPATSAPAIVALCGRKTLLAALKTVCKVVPRRSPKPVLTNVRLTFAGLQTVTLFANNLDVSLSMAVADSEVETSGTFLAPARELLAVVRESGDALLRLEAADGRVRVTGVNTFAELTPDGAANVALYPSDHVEASAAWDGAFTTPASLLAELLAGTMAATYTESSRFALGGVRLELETPTELEAAGGQIAKLLAIGCDGRRLHRVAADVVDYGAADDAFSGHAVGVTPLAACKILADVLKGRRDVLTVARSRNAFTFSGDDYSLAARVLEGRYPRWRDVVPSRSDAYRVTANVGELLAAVKAAKCATTEESRGVDFKFGGGALELEAGTGQKENYRRTFARRLLATTPAGAVEITLDPVYVVDLLAAQDKRSTVELELEDSDGAVVVRSEAGRGNFCGVLMPLARDRN